MIVYRLRDCGDRISLYSKDYFYIGVHQQEVCSKNQIFPILLKAKNLFRPFFVTGADPLTDLRIMS